jgi:hypothetical protein
MVREGLYDIGIVLMPMSRENNEISRQENAYDAALDYFKITDKSCSPCQWVRRDSQEHREDFITRLGEFVESFS